MAGKGSGGSGERNLGVILKVYIIFFSSFFQNHYEFLKRFFIVLIQYSIIITFVDLWSNKGEKKDTMRHDDQDDDARLRKSAKILQAQRLQRQKKIVWWRLGYTTLNSHMRRWAFKIFFYRAFELVYLKKGFIILFM